MEQLASPGVVVLAYLFGAVPFGLLFARFLADIDVRSVGSGNIGATNVLRAAGKKAAVLTLIADLLKGLLPMMLARAVLHDDVIIAITGAAAVLGHNFPVYLRFRGGKGVATSFGVILGITPILGAVCLAAWACAAAVWRYSSLSALVSFSLYPVLVIGLHPAERARGALALFLAAMIYLRHRENIRRLLEGSESQIGKRQDKERT